MKLCNAKFCARCREIFEKDINGACPACTGKHIFPLTQIIPIMTLTGKTLWIKLDMQGIEEIQKAGKKGNGLPPDVCAVDINKIKSWGVLR